MSDVQASPSSSGAAAAATGSPAAGAVQPAAAPAATASSSSGLKDPKQALEAVLVKMLAVFEQLANANVLLSVPQVCGATCGSCCKGDGCLGMGVVRQSCSITLWHRSALVWTGDALRRHADAMTHAAQVAAWSG